MLLDDYIFTISNIFSTIALHSILLDLLTTIGTPSYFKGSVPSLKPIMVRQECCKLQLYPPNIICDFSRLALSPK